MAETSTENSGVRDYGVVVDRWADLADFTVNHVTINVDQDLAPMLAALPDGRCHCPHWGYLLSGRLTVRYADHEEVFEAGDAFHMPAGHVPEAAAGTTFVQFSPTEELAATEAAIQAGMQA